MTKKSMARQMRDQAKKEQQENPNTCWDDLNTIYGDCCLLLTQHAYLANCLHNQELLCEVADRQQLVSNIQLLASDLSKLRDELTELHKQHATKNGGSNNPDDIIESINIFEQYNLFMERHQAVVMPTAVFIIEQISQAEKSLFQKKKALDELTATPIPEGVVIKPPHQEIITDDTHQNNVEFVTTIEKQTATESS